MAKNNEAVHSSFWANVFKTPADRIDLEKSLLAIPPFQSLSKRELDLLFSVIHNRSYLANECIFQQGDPGIGLYIIREGEVKIERKDEVSATIQLAHLKKGDFFGELALVDGEKRSASSIAITDCRLAVIFKPDLDEFIEKYPKKGIKILQGISHIMAIRLRNLNEDYFHQFSKSQIKSGGNYGT
jgi:CRP/FNR family transcriptional regulator, cyclic AMP receptor protein